MKVLGAISFAVVCSAVFAATLVRKSRTDANDATMQSPLRLALGQR